MPFADIGASVQRGFSVFFATAVATLASRTMGETALAKIVATVGPILVMTIATFMILDQLEIAETIVTITYAALLGAVALGSALAFGLGGRDVARELLQGAYEKGREHKDELKRDLDTGMARAKEEAAKAGPDATSSTPDDSEDVSAEQATRRLETVRREGSTGPTA